jgi:hypothetical protein
MRSVYLIVAALMLGQAGGQRSRARVLAESIPGAVPAEFAADLLIRVADSAAAAKEPAEWRADLYEQAFQLASAAQDPLPRNFRRDPRSRMRISPIGPAERLDGLSLQVRAFNGLFAFRRERALALAGTLDVRVPALTCSDSMVPNPGGAFDVARHAYDLLEPQVLSVRSSTQLASAFEAILSADLSTSESRRLVTALTNTMRSLDDDDVSFTDTLGPTWAAVKHAMDSAGDESFSNFILDAFRTYLVLHLSGPRCTSRLGVTATPSAENDTLTEIDETLFNRDRPRLTRRERTPARALESGKGSATHDGIFFGDTGLWRSAISRRLMAQVTGLRAHDQTGRPVDDRRSPEWNEQLSQLYALMATWSRGDEPTPEDYMRERAILLDMLVDVIPSGVERVRALGDLLAFLKSDGRQLFGDTVWASRIRGFMDKCRNSPAEWEWMLRAFLDSGDPIMRLYAQIEELIG